jgi:hypothetical protein
MDCMGFAPTDVGKMLLSITYRLGISCWVTAFHTRCLVETTEVAAELPDLFVA